MIPFVLPINFNPSKSLPLSVNKLISNGIWFGDSANYALIIYSSEPWHSKVGGREVNKRTVKLKEGTMDKVGRWESHIGLKIQ